MATSGSFTGSTANKYITPKIVWSATQDKVNNTSTIEVKLYYNKSSASNENTGGYWSGAISIGGESQSFSGIHLTLKPGGGDVFVTGYSIIVAHSADGSKSVAISATGSIKGTTVTSTTISKSVTLDPIPRKATITSAPNFNDEANPVIQYSNLAGNAVTTLQACISLTGDNDDVPYRNISKTGSSYTFNLTSAERATLRNACANAKSRSVRFYIRTTIGGETYHSYASKTLSIVNAAPTLSPTVVDANSNTVALTGDNAKFIKYYSNASYEIGAAALKGATIKSRSAVCGAKSNTTESGTLLAVESASFVFSATDSRGFTTNKTVNKTLVDYVKLTCGLGSTRFTPAGAIAFTVSGKCFNGSFGAKTNTLAVQYRYKRVGGSYGSWASVVPVKNGNSYSVSIELSGLDYTQKYVIQARAFDALATVETTEKTLSCIPVFDWGENDFRFNAPVDCAERIAFINNGGAGIYGTNTAGDVVSGLQPCNANDNCVLGYGNYTEGLGGTNVYGNYLRMFAKEDATLHDSSGSGVTYSLLGLLRAFSTAYSLSSTAAPGPNYTTASSTAVLHGNMLSVFFSATRSSNSNAGNVSNEAVATVTITHGGKIKGAGKVSFCNAGSGPVSSYVVDGITVNSSTIVITFHLTATGTALASMSAYALLPVQLNYSAFV